VKSLLRQGTRPVVVEIIIIIVLLLALYEVAGTVFHQVRLHKRRKFLVRFISEGHLLENSIPSDSQDQLLPWTDAVQRWITQTSATLETFSSEAVAYFNQGLPMNIAYPNAPPALGRTLDMLRIRLDNLRMILERPDRFYY
jgi:hypothetical protein